MRYPTLYQINTRVWLTELSQSLGRQATLDDVPDAELDRLAAKGFQWIWLLSVWQTGKEGQRLSRTNPDWRREFEETLPDLTDDDIPGSGFAITGYVVHKDLGGDAALARLRKRLKQRGLKLMLDFVPNHTALDHPWVESHPEYYVRGSELDLAREPRNYVWVQRKSGPMLLALGRDPYFPGWPDALQLNYAEPALQEAMTQELIRISGQCDGVRCDMAMLVLPEVFERTWDRASHPFWPRATQRVRERTPGFTFMAEVYWDLEWTLQQQGFDYCYDKRLYDRLHGQQIRAVHDHFLAGLDYQDKLARFLENHDEPRAAANFPLGPHQAAAVITYLSPGLRFFHQGQFEGRLKRISPHLGRAPNEPVNGTLQQFYDKLLAVLRQPELHDGRWQLLDGRPAWSDNWTFESFMAFAWTGTRDERTVVVVNYSPHQSQCYLPLPFDLANRTWTLRDRLSPDAFDRDGNDLTHRGLYLDVQPWQAAVYTVKEA